MGFVSKIIKSVADIRPQERFKTAVMLGYFFLTISLIYILKPVRNAFFLEELGAKNLRYVYMGEGLFLILVAAAFVWISKRIPKKLFFVGTLLFLASNLVVFWYLFDLKPPYLSAYFYIWVSSYSIISTTLFWMLANDIFSSDEAKRLFGFIIAGGSAGGILGGLLTSALLKWLRAEELLLVAASIVGGCAFFVGSFWKRIYQPHQQVNAHQEKKATTAGGKVLLGSSYLIMLALLIVLAKMSSTIIDNQFNRMVELTYLGREAKAAFIANFFTGLNAASLAAQLLLTSFCLRYLGVGVSLFILPFGLAGFSLATILSPVFLSALMLRIFDGSINYSIQQAGKEMLFLPLASEVRYRVKPVIDMLGFRIAKTLSGVYIAILAPLLGLADEKLGLLVLFLIPLWIFLVWRLKKMSPDA